MKKTGTPRIRAIPFPGPIFQTEKKKKRERERENERQYIELRISGALNPCILDTSIYSKLLANRCIDYSL